MVTKRILVTVVLCIAPILSRAVILEWDRNAETNVAGYRAYYGVASRSYSAVVDVGNAVTATINRLIPGETYYFAVTAYTVDGLESDFSDEVSYTTPAAATGSPCVGCFSSLDDLLVIRGSNFPRIVAARLAMPTNGACLDAGLSTFNAIAKAAGRNTNSELGSALSSVALCLKASLQQRLADETAESVSLLPSRWSRTATNQLARMDTMLNGFDATAPETAQARTLLALGRLSTRTAGIIRSGDVAPLSLSNRLVQFTLTRSGRKTTEIVSFGDSTFTSTNTVDQGTSSGSYSYQRTSWNGGALTLVSENGPTETWQLTFGRRWRVAGESVKGMGTEISR